MDAWDLWLFLQENLCIHKILHFRWGHLGGQLEGPTGHHPKGHREEIKIQVGYKHESKILVEFK